MPNFKFHAKFQISCRIMPNHAESCRKENPIFFRPLYFQIKISVKLFLITERVLAKKSLKKSLNWQKRCSSSFHLSFVLSLIIPRSCRIPDPHTDWLEDCPKKLISSLSIYTLLQPCSCVQYKYKYCTLARCRMIPVGAVRSLPTGIWVPYKVQYKVQPTMDTIPGTWYKYSYKLFSRYVTVPLKRYGFSTNQPYIHT